MRASTGERFSKRVRLNQRRGHVEVGDGDGTFRVFVDFHRDGDSLLIDLDSRPWSLVQTQKGIGLGRTPMRGVDARESPGFRLVCPSPKSEWLVEVRYVP